MARKYNLQRTINESEVTCGLYARDFDRVKYAREALGQTVKDGLKRGYKLLSSDKNSAVFDRYGSIFKFEVIRVK